MRAVGGAEGRASPAGRAVRAATVRPQVLLAEDDDAMRELLSVEISRLGCDVHAVPDGLHAAAVLSRVRYDAAILDVRMPNRTGLEVVMRLRQSGSALPVVLISGFADGVEDLGPHYRTVVLAKPFTMAQLARALERAIAAAAPRPAS